MLPIIPVNPGVWKAAPFASTPHSELATNLPPYLPLASWVKPLQLNNFERQVLILLATPPVIRDYTLKTTAKGKLCKHELYELMLNWRAKCGNGRRWDQVASFVPLAQTHVSRTDEFQQVSNRSMASRNWSFLRSNST